MKKRCYVLFSRPLTLELGDDFNPSSLGDATLVDLGSELDVRTTTEQQFRFSPRLADRLIHLRVAYRVFKGLLSHRGTVVTGRYGEDFARLRGVLGVRTPPMILLDVEWRHKRIGGLTAVLSRISHRLVARGATKIGVFCEEEAKRYAEWYGISPNKFVWIPYCTEVDPADYSCEDGGYVFSAGSYDRDWELFFRAIRDLPIEIRIAAAESTIPSELDIPTNVRLLGRLSFRDYHQALANASLIALALRDNHLRCPGIRTYVAAMRLGKCVVVNDPLGAASYIRNGETGVLVPSDSSEELRMAIQNLCSDAAKRRSIGEHAREYAATHFCPSHYVQALSALVASLSNPQSAIDSFETRPPQSRTREGF
jgi:glycosyltransferase involved in cell wall biosynthesis